MELDCTGATANTNTTAERCLKGVHFTMTPKAQKSIRRAALLLALAMGAFTLTGCKLLEALAGGAGGLLGPNAGQTLPGPTTPLSGPVSGALPGTTPGIITPGSTTPPRPTPGTLGGPTTALSADAQRRLSELDAQINQKNGERARALELYNYYVNNVNALRNNGRALTPFEQQRVTDDTSQANAQATTINRLDGELRQLNDQRQRIASGAA
jgi:hypothetical protein